MELTMHLPPVQINRLTRDMNELKFKIKRCEKHNNTVKAERLKEKLSYMEDMFEEMEMLVAA